MAIDDKWFDNLYTEANIEAEVPDNRSIRQIRSDLQQTLKRLEGMIESGLPMLHTPQQVSNFLANMSVLMNVIEMSFDRNQVNVNQRNRLEQDVEKHRQLTERINNVRERAIYPAQHQALQPQPILAEQGVPPNQQQARELSEQDEADTTTVLTLTLSIKEFRVLVFAQLNLCDQGLLRLVCKNWNNTVCQAMRNKERVCICMSVQDLYPEEYLYDFYNIKKRDELLTLLERHVNVRHLMIWNRRIEPIWTDQDIILRIASMTKLRCLEIQGFSLSYDTFRMLRKLPQLCSIKLNGCEMAGEYLRCLNENIREISIEDCTYLGNDKLLPEMQAFHTRGISLQKLEIDISVNNSSLLPLAQFMLEHFASLRVLYLRNYALADVGAGLCPLKQMVAENIEELTLINIKWPSESHHHQFFATLLARPLPHLHTLNCSATNIQLNEDTMKRLWDMCPKLDIYHICTDQQCQQRLGLAQERLYRAM